MGRVFFSRGDIGYKRIEWGVKYSSPGRLIELIQGTGSIFSSCEIWTKNFCTGFKNASRGLTDGINVQEK